MHHPPGVARRPGHFTARRSQAVLAASLSLSVLAATVAGGQIRTSSATHQGLMVNDQWNWLASTDVFETKAGTTVSVQLTAHVPRLEGSLLDLVSQTLATKEAVVPKAQLVVVDFNGKPMSATTLGKPHIQEIHLPAVDAAGSTTPLAFSVKFFPAAEADAAAPATIPPAVVIQPADKMLASNFTFATDTTWHTVTSVDSMVVSSPGPGAWTMPTLVLVERSSAATLSALQKSLASGLAMEGTLTLLSPNLTTPLLIERFYGLRVQSFATVPASAPQRVKVTMTMTALRLGTTATALK